MTGARPIGQSFVASLLPFAIGFAMGVMASVASFASRISVVETKVDAIQQTISHWIPPTIIKPSALTVAPHE